jgi:hypothetical protein
VSAPTYGICRCAVCGVQRSEGPECGACGAPNSKREWTEVIPLSDLLPGVVEPLTDCLAVLHGDVLDSNDIARIEVDVRAALYRLGHREPGARSSDD